jgi:hypothetical protein
VREWIESKEATTRNVVREVGDGGIYRYKNIAVGNIAVENITVGNIAVGNLTVQKIRAVGKNMLNSSYRIY